ncbi:very-short-patch-repair endonuclease [Kineosphaera limosa]|uniref:DUF559 domain-containing protein n=1 Tax=Kineosphaera limosa NBRC 100340 TaxID=1184609 RepID=K6XBH1_9MICO|nr:hypothetical protein [Kineosphaera limosa]NYE01947.1 very-short-patch-repair endonuclease [Kineosphaera limosa]GAB96174.1 hypothetical protein KILIM_032_00600 [Kineosphaera limosa NBRC 100340]
MTVTPLPGIDLGHTKTAAVRSYVVASGGAAAYGELEAATGWRAIKAAVAAGIVVRRGRGIYVLPDHDAVTSPPALDQSAFDPVVLATRRTERAARHRQAAEQFRAARSHRSAADHYGLPVLVEPRAPELILPRGRRLPPLPHEAVLRRRELTTAERRDGVTTPVRTVLDCAADLPFEEALAIADSALRSDTSCPSLVSRSELLEALDSVRCQAQDQALRVIKAADGRAANPFESAVRAIALDVPGLNVEPQVQITVDGVEHRVDLADRALRIVLECDSYAWHSSRRAFSRDCERYSGLVAQDWLVLRLTWRAVILQPARVREQIAAVVALRQAQQRFAAYAASRAAG